MIVGEIFQSLAEISYADFLTQQFAPTFIEKALYLNCKKYHRGGYRGLLLPAKETGRTITKSTCWTPVAYIHLVDVEVFCSQQKKQAAQKQKTAPRGHLLHIYTWWM